MWTGQWWHVLQSKLPQGGTLAPVIIATDKTQLTQFSGGKAAYPVYLTIGNIPKATRRKLSKHACILVAYLSRVFHESMRAVLEPLINAGKGGIEMTSSNGACKVKASDLANATAAPKRTQLWTSSVIQDAKADSGGNRGQFHKYCMSFDVAGRFPLVDIHQTITPDVLHQLYQGVFKHLVSWCQRLLKKGKLDQRIRSLPPGYGLHHFKNGFSALSQVSGSERKNMAKIILGCLVGSIPPDGSTYPYQSSATTGLSGCLLGIN
ncbi:hypothetical protein HYPSUDRAFT_73095 [Hypholoma sublateritium FD-334 SS-4]|uniref:Uncharacterized protein n=1 Tax=Hypholoma sublateritium (strain FD-334 SS-4) TaxID=945553 RepID=A0A0D2N9F2_HYPSF|nr:hypothetical protein HYPSUDRAFT_73095 [Hypholoma sublateritium FD-334 SS-4]